MPCRDARALRPMLAQLAEPPLTDPQLVYELKYDGIRALVEIVPVDSARRGTARVRIFSRLGNDKTAQFPEIVKALSRFGATLPSTIILDGEIVALDEQGEPAGFQQLQGRIHLTSIEQGEAAERPVALMAFDLLCEGGRELCDLPLTERRARLERVFAQTLSPLLRLSEMVTGDGRPLFAQATKKGWERSEERRVGKECRL